MEDFERKAILYVVGTFGERGADLEDIQSNFFIFMFHFCIADIHLFVFFQRFR